MSQKDLEKVGLRHGPSGNKGFPNQFFIVGHDGKGSTRAARVEWFCSRFPKFADSINPKDTDPRSDLPIPESEIRVFSPANAKAVLYESKGVSFPDDCGEWSGMPLLVVSTGRQTVKTARIVNERRVAKGESPIEIVAMGKRYATALERVEANVIENRQIITTSVMQRAWGAYRLVENGKPRDEAMILVNVTSEQGLQNLLSLLDCSESVQQAVDAGPDAGGITQSAALDMLRKSKGDHASMDLELAKRLGAAAGKTGRARSSAIRGESDGKPKPVSPKVLGRVSTAILAADASDPHGWAAIVRWATGDADAYDALPDGFREKVNASSKVAKKKPGAGKAGEQANDEQKAAA